MKALCGLAAGATCALLTQVATAEVSLGEVKGWEVFTAGSVNAFVTYTGGEGSPEGLQPDRQVLPGGGLVTAGDRIPPTLPDGTPDLSAQGDIAKWRVRSGFIPNVLSLGARSQVTPDLKLTAQAAIWGTIEVGGMRKYQPVLADFREAFGRAEGSWGAVTLGRTLSLFSRGMYEVARDYGHRYGVGHNSALVDPGAAAGMIGFGVAAPSYNPGIYYTTPSLAGLRINLGVYDPVRFGAWTRTDTPRPETEITYDFASPSGWFKTHVFVNGAYQKLYKDSDASVDATLWGMSGGLKVELGPIHLGGGGHYGRGLGVNYAMNDLSNASTLQGPLSGVDPNTMIELNSPNELRKFDGFSAFVQYSHPKFDINLAAGQSRAHQLKIDQVLPHKLIKTQTGLALAFVYHVSENLHLDADYMRAMYRWYKSEKQDVNFFNAGATIDW